jgi:RNA polymerase sigma-70 factor (ECF subfamily)
MDTLLADRSDGELLFSDNTLDECGFRELVHRYQDSLYSFLRGFFKGYDQLEDAFQVTFLQAYRRRETFDTDRPFKPWLFTIAANTAKDMLRKSRRHTTVAIGGLTATDGYSFEEALSTFISKHDSPYENLVHLETAAAIRAVVHDLPEHLREVLVLAYFHCFSYKEMTILLSIPLGTVKSRLHYAVACFAKRWREYLSLHEEMETPLKV